MLTRQSPRAFIRLLQSLFCLCFLPLSIHVFAGPAEPPLELLFSPESRLVGATLVEINPAGRLVFKRDKVYGESTDVPELIDAGVGVKALKTAKIGEHYIVGYTTFHHDKQYPAGITPSRKTTNVISSIGLDPALFVDSAELRKILTLAATEHGRESSKLRGLLLNTFGEDKPALQRLAAGQIARDADMSAALNAKGRSIVKKAAFNKLINPTTRSLLITAAADRPGDFGPWAADAVNEVLEITPVDGYPDGTEDHTGLVLLSFDEATTWGYDVPFQSLTRWLASTHQLYLERAAALLIKLYPERSKPAFETALAKSIDNTLTHQFLEGKLRELNRHDVETGTRKQ